MGQGYTDTPQEVCLFILFTLASPFRIPVTTRIPVIVGTTKTFILPRVSFLGGGVVDAIYTLPGDPSFANDQFVLGPYSNKRGLNSYVGTLHQKGCPTISL